MKISITVSNSLKKDPRVIKQVKCAIAAGHSVQFVGYRDQFFDKAFLNDLGCRVDIVDLGEKYVGHIPSLWGKIRRMYLRFVLPIRYICDFKPDVIHANDFDTLLFAYKASRKTGAAIVYDSHEIFAENIGITDNKWLKRFIIFNECRLVKKVDAMICVSHAAQSYFSNKYGVEPIVITNCPMLNNVPLRLKATDRFEVVYQGLIVKGRGYEEFVESATMLGPDCRLVIRGYGSAEHGLHRIVEQKQLEDKVTFAEPVDVKELISAASSSHVGVVLTRPVNINFQLSVSNKVFEYAHAGLPEILSDVAEHRYLNDRYNFAIILPEVTPEAIAEAILRLKNNPTLYATLSNNAKRMSVETNWENESMKLLDIYNRVYHG